MKKILLLKLLVVLLAINFTSITYAQTAIITSFSLDKTIVNTGFNNNKPTAQFTAYFSGANIDLWKITIDCPLPTTVRGLEERINLIKTGGIGVTSPSKEGQQCNITQKGSASLTRFTFLLINPFKTPQSVVLTLGAYSWDGTKNIRGDIQSKTLTVLPILDGEFNETPKGPATITSFNASSYNLVSGELSNLTWAGSNINDYRLFLTCPNGVSVIIEKNEACNISTSIGQNTQALLKFTNTLVNAQLVMIRLRAYGSHDKFDQESQLTITVNPVSRGPAMINFFRATTNIVSSGNTVSFSWSGSNVGYYAIYFSCPVNTSVILEKQSACGKSIPVGLNTSELIKFTNNSQAQQQITVELRAYGQGDKYDSREAVIVTVLPN